MTPVIMHRILYRLSIATIIRILNAHARRLRYQNNTSLFRLLLMMSDAVPSYQRYDFQSHNHQSSAKEYSKNITIYN